MYSYIPLNTKISRQNAVGTLFCIRFCKIDIEIPGSQILTQKSRHEQLGESEGKTGGEGEGEIEIGRERHDRQKWSVFVEGLLSSSNNDWKNYR